VEKQDGERQGGEVETGESERKRGWRGTKVGETDKRVGLNLIVSIHTQYLVSIQ
jgi:hypothetical protein